MYISQSAFPMNCPDHADASDYVAQGMAGLTKLEYAAVHIMAGMYALPNVHGSSDERAKWAATAARSLFAELEKDNG